MNLIEGLIIYDSAGMIFSFLMKLFSQNFKKKLKTLINENKRHWTPEMKDENIRTLIWIRFYFLQLKPWNKNIFDC